MNRAFFIILIPALLIALGYVLVFRAMGMPPGYRRLVIAMTLFFGAIYWLGRRAARKAKANG
jgi:ABC-type spermidine/putrescine transport system permease subunit II